MIFILGLGLVGGSLALALQSGYRVCGWDQNAETRSKASAAGIEIIDPDDLEEVDLSFVALPAHNTAEGVLRLLRVGPVCDTASVKEEIARTITRESPGASYIGGHPLGGGTLSGWAGANAETLRGVPWALVGDDIPLDHLLLVSRVLEHLGSSWLAVDPAEHDRALARTSHLVQIIQSALAAEMCEWSPLALRLSGPALRDTTRLARSSLQMWNDIIESNEANISGALFAFLEELRDSQLLLDDSAGLRMLWRHAEMGRDALEETRWNEERWRSASVPLPRFWQELLRRSQEGALFRGARSEKGLLLVEQSG